MPDRASIFQTVQVGVETTSGAVQAANKKLQSLAIEPGIKAEVDAYKPTGNKFATVAALNKEWVEAKVSGKPVYDEIIYPLAGIFGAPTTTQPDAVNAATAYQHVFSSNSSAADTPKTFTVEQGSAERAHRFAYGLMVALGMKVSREAVELEGKMMGQALVDAITLTASPSVLPLIPVLSSHFEIKLADSQSGLTAASALTRGISAEWEISDKFGPIWTIARGTSSWGAHIDTDPKLSAKLKLAADAVGMGLLTTMRSGATKFLRIDAVGDTIAGTVKYKCSVDLALKVTDVSEFEDEDGLYAVEWEFEGAHDGTWNKAISVTVINTQSGL
ncbi:MAG: hypothetical protein M3P51_15590 [Chloroflexota bacterium]|nr:hypothetical protein [Chloroflexota bacterium]